MTHLKHKRKFEVRIHSIYGNISLFRIFLLYSIFPRLFKNKKYPTKRHTTISRITQAPPVRFSPTLSTFATYSRANTYHSRSPYYAKKPDKSPIEGKPIKFVNPSLTRGGRKAASSLSSFAWTTFFGDELCFCWQKRMTRGEYQSGR